MFGPYVSAGRDDERGSDFAMSETSVENTGGLVFEDPPAQVQRERKSAIFTDEVVAGLKANPGKWAVLLSAAKSSQVGNAQAWAKRRPGFEVTSRTVDRDSETPNRVYARFNPDRIESDQQELAEKSKK